MVHKQETIGHYHILDTLARGARGYVYRAEDIAARSTPVAVKIMESTPLRTESERGAFLQEVERMRTLHSVAIVPIIDAGLYEDIPYLVMPYLSGGSLFERLPRAGARSLPLEITLSIIVQVGAALHYAHQQQRVHSNLKPANILFGDYGNALLADFALTSLLPGGRRYGVGVGNPLYMAPEQFRGFISPAGDQYALGCIAYQMVSGRLPFNGNDFVALGFKHLSDPPVPPAQWNPLLPRTVEQAILRALAKQPDERFPDLAAFTSALSASSSSAYTPVAETSQKRPEDEDDEEDATVIRPLYGKKTPRARRRSPNGPPTHYPADNPSAPIDPLPRLLEEPLPADGSRHLSGAPAHNMLNSSERATFAADIAADRADSGPLQDLSVVETIRTNQVFDIAQHMPLSQESMPAQEAPPLLGQEQATAPTQHMVAPSIPRKKRRSWFKLFGLLPAALFLSGTLPAIATLLHCLKMFV